MRRGVIGLETFIHAKFVCVGNHTQSLTALKVSKPLPKQLAPLSMKAIMNVTHLVALEQSPWSDRRRNQQQGGRTVHFSSLSLSSLTKLVIGTKQKNNNI